jgi:hypothetical protein
MSTITVDAPRTNNWVVSQIALAGLIVLAVALLAFSVGRITAADHSSTSVPRVITEAGSKWGAHMCAHGVPCR